MIKNQIKMIIFNKHNKNYINININYYNYNYINNKLLLKNLLLEIHLKGIFIFYTIFYIIYNIFLKFINIDFFNYYIHLKIVI